MTSEKKIELLNLLINTTKEKKLEWTISEETKNFTATIGSCRIEVIKTYKAYSESTSVYLYNSDGYNFEIIPEEDFTTDSEREGVAKLYDEIRDAYYRITESETEIFNTLSDMLLTF